MKKFYVLLIFIILLASCSTIETDNHSIVHQYEPIVIASVPTETPIPTPIPPAPTLPPEIPQSKSMVALTFDDGPSAHTEKILDILERYDSKATFFVVGNRLGLYQETILRAAKLGNEIANHSQTHARFTSLSDNDVINEIQSASSAIKSITGISPHIYRPPFGATDERIVNISTELGYGIVKWNLDPLDWRDRDADIIYHRIMSQVEDGSVIVLHDIHLTTAQAMERVIPSIIEKGFQLVTVSELLDYRYGGLDAGSIFGSYCAWRIWE
ncbi:MAG: polysaccharide deacetylase family protein [Defluviitaleaceae bacterium]|nr:polysaccharide deacetylase family protein [Defluviitaleaceae bacterium]